MKHGLADVVDALHLSRYLAVGTRVLPVETFVQRLHRGEIID